jgi:hypothetical protein
MKKTLVVLVCALLVACNQESDKEVHVEGNWKFEKYVEGKIELVPENEMMVKSIVNLFKGAQLSLQDGKVTMKSAAAGHRKGTYTVTDAKLHVQFSEKSQFSLHVSNQDSTRLLILFNENGEKQTGKIVLLKYK